MEASSPLRSCAAQGRSSPTTTRGGPPPSEPWQVGRPGELAAHGGAMARTRAATSPASWPPTEERRRRRGLQRAAVLRWPPGGSRWISSVFLHFFSLTFFCLQNYMQKKFHLRLSFVSDAKKNLSEPFFVLTVKIFSSIFLILFLKIFSSKFFS